MIALHTAPASFDALRDMNKFGKIHGTAGILE